MTQYLRFHYLILFHNHILIKTTEFIQLMMMSFIIILILDIVVLTCAFDDTMDSIIENEHFKEMIENVANIKSQNIQLAIKVKEVFNKNIYLETEMNTMRKENEQLLDHIKTIKKQNQKCLASNCK